MAKVKLMSAEEAKALTDATYNSNKLVSGMLKDLTPAIKSAAKNGLYKLNYTIKDLTENKIAEQLEAELVSKKFTVRYKIDLVYKKTTFDISWAEPSKTDPKGEASANDN